MNYLEGLAQKEMLRAQSWRRSAVWLAGLILLGIAGASLVGELEPKLSGMAKFLQDISIQKGWPVWIPAAFFIFIPPAVLLGIMMGLPMFVVWWERKVAAHTQVRLGPMEVGGWHGWAQVMADGIKLFLKEIIEPDGIDKWVFRLAPFVVFIPAYLSFAPLPFGKGLVVLNLDTGVLFLMAVSGLSTVGILMAGWGSANKYSLLGGLRGAAQVVSYEIPRFLSCVPVVMWVGSLSLTRISAAQSGFLWGWLPRWFIFYPVVGQISFAIYLITTIAETNRVPFDVPEAESELVCGFHTEYGGMMFAFFFLAEYSYVFAGSLLGAVLFLGGGAPLFSFLGFIPSWAWLLGKTFLLVFVFLLARWTLPRLRVDRIMDLCWKVFLEWTFVVILAMGFVILWRVK